MTKPKAKTSQSVPEPIRKTAVARGASSTGETVTVALKLPAGILIRGMRKMTRSVPVLGGGMREETYFEPDGREVEIFGTARPFGGAPKTRVVAGYALTSGVPKDLWAQWLEANEGNGLVKNGLIFEHKSVEGAADAAKENRASLSGFEPLNPKGDPRNPKPLSSRVTAVSELQMGDEAA